MTTTIVAQIVDKLGTSAWWWTGTYGGQHLTEIRSYPAASFPTVQPGTIGISITHDGPRIGHVAYLEHGISNDDLTAVAVLDCDPEDIAGLFCSGEITAHRPLGSTIATRSTLDGIGLVTETAGVAAPPIKAYPGDYRYSRGGWGTPKILERAKAARNTEDRTAHPTETRIHRPTPVEARSSVNNDRPFVRQPTGRYRMIEGRPVELEYSAPIGKILSVR